MRQVLIVEDNATKRTAIERALPRGLDCVGTPSIAQSYKLLTLPWDLIILDMTFQVFERGGVQPAMKALAGIELLQYIRKRRLKFPVIVATQHVTFSSSEMPGIDTLEQLDLMLRRIFPDNYRATIRVDLAEDGWKSALREAVMGVLDD